MSMTRFINGANTEADNAIFKQLGTFSPSAYLPDIAIGINFGITTAAAANTMTIDYVFAAKER